MFTTNSVWLMFFLFWLFGIAMSSFACCVSVFLESSQSASNAGLAIVLVSWTTDVAMTSLAAAFIRASVPQCHHVSSPVEAPCYC